MTWNATYSRNDHEGERGSTTVRIPTVTAANFDTMTGLIDDLNVEVETLCLGSPVVLSYGSTVYTNPSNTKDANNLAQVENKWLVRYHDNVTFELGSSELPCADLSLLPLNEEFLDLTAAPASDFVTAYEAVVISRKGNAVTVDSIQFVGRTR